MLGELEHLRITVVIEDTVPYESSLLAAHGISFYIEAYNQNTVKSILFDLGQSPEALLENMEKLSINPATIDMIVLSHCHYDHTRGLVKVLKAIGKEDIPVVAHTDIFRLNFITIPYLRHVGIDLSDREERIKEAGGRLFMTGDPLQLMEGVTTTGEVPRITDFEEVGIPLKTIKSGKIVDDKMPDDISLIAKVKDKGMIILTGCSHAGIVNITKHSISIAKSNRIAAIIGGFHLIEATEERIDKTATALKDFDIHMLSAGHCTGRNAQEKLKAVFKERWKDMGSGTTFEF